MEQQVNNEEVIEDVEMEPQLLDDVEIGDVLSFRNGGQATVAGLEYDEAFDGSLMATIWFEGCLEDSWTFHTDGTMFEDVHSIFDIVEVIDFTS